MGSVKDMKAAEKTYNGFTGALKWAVPLAAFLVLIVILLIS